MTGDLNVPPFLLSSVKFGIQLGLMRMQSLLRRLGNPEADMRCIHVAGTNGKGSTVAFISSILAAAGHRTGIYTSPYLERFSERIRILDGQDSLDRYFTDDREGEIPREALFRLSSRVEAAVGDMLADDEEHPTEFELVTAVAFLYFREKNCDYIVLETGLGGRLDSTNVIEKPIATVITALGYDHTDRLGTTIREIAFEKAGIIKDGCPVFLYDPHALSLTPNEAADIFTVINERAKELHTSCVVVSPDTISDVTANVDGQSFTLEFFGERVSIGLLGAHQTMNAALSVRVMLHLVPHDAILEGLRKAIWKGRLEVLRKSPLILLDGGHNPQGAEAFARATGEIFAEEFRHHPPRLILGFMRDKDVSSILSVLEENVGYPIEEFLCVTPDNPRSMPGEELAGILRFRRKEWQKFYKNTPSMYNGQGKIQAFPTVPSACREALLSSGRDDAPILCVGSLYLAGEARQILVEGRKETTDELA